jgi:hypothetical protein
MFAGSCMFFVAVVAMGLSPTTPVQPVDPYYADSDRVKAKKIPLDSIYFTGEQEGVKLVGKGDEKVRVILEELYDKASGIGASNIFLTRGNGIERAVKATWSVFANRVSADTPVAFDPQEESGDFWVAAFLGVDGPGSAFQIESAQIEGKVIRLSFTREHSDIPARHPYLVWIPVARLNADTYRLELFDKARQQVTLIRIVVIPKKR